jgi:hypothetical protein
VEWFYAGQDRFISVKAGFLPAYIGICGSGTDNFAVFDLNGRRHFPNAAVIANAVLSVE